jgi:putative Holliday junction resolvase
LKRILGLDYGSKTVGVAVSDPLGFTAQALEIIRRKSEKKLRQTLARIEQLVEEYDIGTIVLGLPLNMNSEQGDRAQKSLEFKELVEKRTGLDVVMWDERLTTVEAIEIMNEAGIKPQDRKLYVDKIAAGFILQDYLNYQELKKHE